MINEALRLLRIFHDYKSKDLSEMLGISQSYLSEIENGHKSPSIDLINKYAELFNIRPSAIMFFSEELNQGKSKTIAKNTILKLMKALEKFGEYTDGKEP